MIKAAGNTELCEIVDVEPKAQCKACLAYWDVGIVYCTCGHFLRDDTAENKKYIKSVLDLFSIPNFYIRKGRPHGHRYGKKVIKNITLRINSKRSVRKGEMDRTDWRTKITPILLQKKNSTYIVAIGGYVRTLWVPTRCR